MTTVYAKGYMSAYLGQGRAFGAHFFFLPVLIVSMMMVAVSSHVIIFLIMWEIMSLSSFFLMTFENEKKEVLDAGVYYITAMHVCVAFLTAGFAVLSSMSGSFDFASFKTALAAARPAAGMGIFAVLFTGFAIKAGLMPFHTWLPLAHPAAPSHVSALMSGVMIKLGIYGILRLITFYAKIGSGISFAILALGLVTGLLGIYFAMAQRDIKRLLAYSSIENIGIMTTGIGLGLLGLSTGNNYMAYFGFAGALLHALNHSLFKELLFFGAGSVYMKAHTRDMEHLGGLSKSMPYTAGFFFAGAVAISALPPLNGFVGELMLYLSMFSGISLRLMPVVVSGVLSLAGLSFIGAMAVVVFTKTYSVVFSGNPRNDSIRVKPGENIYMVLSMGAAVFFCVVIGIFPQYFFRLAAAPAGYIMAAATAAVPDIGPFLNTLRSLSVLFISAIIAVFALYLIKKAALKGKTASGDTWGCGYQAPSPRIQYTASSFASVFLMPKGPLIKIEEDTAQTEGLFPKKASYISKARDIIAAMTVKPAIKAVSFVMRGFSWIQSGNTQQYILYGLVFLIIAIVWAMGAV